MIHFSSASSTAIACQAASVTCESVCVSVLVAYSLAKSPPPPQVGQLRNGSWNRHGNNSSGQVFRVSHQWRLTDGALCLIIQTPPGWLPEKLRPVNGSGFKIHPPCSFTLFSWTMSQDGFVPNLIACFFTLAVCYLTVTKQAFFPLDCTVDTVKLLPCTDRVLQISFWNVTHLSLSCPM